MLDANGKRMLAYVQEIGKIEPLYLCTSKKNEETGANEYLPVLDKKGKKTFADNIETGMAYQGPVYSIEKFKNCIKQNDHAITGIDPDDPCKLKLKLQLENYRWLLADEEAIKKAFTCKMLHGSTISIDSVAIDSVYKDEKSNLQRKITATIYLNVQNMQSHCDVIEWSFNPCAIDTAPGEIVRFFGAQDWREFDKTYSIENFITGMFRGAHLNTCSLKPNYILLSVH